MLIENLGDSTADNSSLTLNINGSDFTVAVPALDAALSEGEEEEEYEGEGNNSTAIVTFTTNGPLPAGTYPVTATVNPGQSLIESDFANNALTRSITVTVTPDLTLSNLTIEPSLAVAGENVTFSVDVILSLIHISEPTRPY